MAKIADAAKLLRGQKLACLAGAGVSRASGLPIANDLTDAILAKIGATKREATALRSARMPFELFIETLLIFSELSPIYRIYRGGAPCAFHELAARWAQAGRLISVVTPNFDNLFEQAFRQHSVAYQRVWREAHFKNWAPRQGRLPLLKVHGSAHDDVSLGITIRRVSGRQGVELREALLRSAFSNVGADMLLVVGYSGSDKFDITPILGRLRNSAPPVVLVSHDRSAGTAATISNIRGNRKAGPFAVFDGYIVECDTDQLIRALGVGARTFVQRHDFLKNVDQWYQAALQWHDPALREYTLAALMQSAARPDLARPYFISCQSQSISAELKARASIGEARSGRDLGHFAEAVSAARRGYRLAARCGVPRLRAVASLELGILAADNKNSVSALRFYKRAEREARKAKAQDIVGIALGNSAIVLKNLGGPIRLKRALRNHQEALDIAISAGDKRSEGRTLGNIGNVYSAMGDETNAITYFRWAHEVAVLLGDAYHEAIWLANEGNELFKSNPRGATAKVERAKRIFAKLKSKSRVQDCDQYLKDFRRNRRKP